VQKGKELNDFQRNLLLLQEREDLGWWYTVNKAVKFRNAKYSRTEGG
jgi:hypothetical protein